MALRLFAFPHAGGNHTAFQDWPAGLPDDVEVVSYALPGRGRRRAEAPYERLTDLVDDLAAMVKQYDDGAPFAFFGHSFGALVAYEVTRKLADLRGRCPGLLAVSAHRAPHLPPDRPAHRLPQGDFLDRVRLWGLIPDDLLESIAVVGRREEIAGLVRERVAGITDTVSIECTRRPDPEHFADIVAALQ